MGKIILCVVALLCAGSVSAQTPTRVERATVATLFASSSVSMVPVWITATCTTAGTCREVNPVMNHLIGNGPVRAIIVKSAVSFGSHYLVWRLPSTTKKQKALRLGLALGLLTINTYDAVHDIRVYRRINAR